MNSTKLVAALVAALSVGSSFAAGPIKYTTNYVVGNQIHIAGSTALGNQSLPAVHAYATNQGFAMVAADKMDPTILANQTLANIQGTKIALYTKVTTVTNGTKVTITTNSINCHFIGSEGGIAVTAGSKVVSNWLPLTATGKVAGDTAGAGGIGYNPSTNCTLVAPATITFADNIQAVSRFSTAKTSPVKCVALTNVASLCALNFAWVAPTNFPASNITDRVVQSLLANGHVPLSFFTGNAADASTGVFVTGRDIDSGTRVCNIVEAGLGTLAPLKQYVYVAGSNAIIATAGGTVNGIAYTAGNGGHFSGGDLCSAVIAASTNWSNNNFAILDGANGFAPVANPYTNGSYLIGYAGSKDILGKGKTKALSYNGVAPYSPTAYPGFDSVNNGIANGSYSLWSVGRLYMNVANAPKGTDKLFVASTAYAIANNVTNGVTTAGFGAGYTALGDLQVTRAQEGATINKK